MKFACSLLVLTLVALFALRAFDPPFLFAQGSKLGLSPQDQQRYDELMESARRNEMIAYIAIGVGIITIIVAVPLKIYLDRKKRLKSQSDAASSRPDRSPAVRTGEDDRE